MNGYVINLLIHGTIEATDFILTNIQFSIAKKNLLISFDEFAFRNSEESPWLLLKEPQLVISGWDEFAIVITSHPGKRWNVTAEDQLVRLINLCESSFNNEEIILSGFSEDYTWIEYHIIGAKASLHFKEKRPWPMT